jgi:GcrA cell cycle regulator
MIGTAPMMTHVPAMTPKPAPAPRVVAPAPRPYGRVVTCCWPIGEPGTRSFRFCDDASEPGKPYCSDHAKLAYVKVRDRREDAA